MEIVGWVIWFLTCGYGVICLIAFLSAILSPVHYPDGPQVLYPFFLRRLITGFAALGFTGASVITVLIEISKLHLLWFVPLWHFFGLQRWIEWIYLSFKPELLNLVYPESDVPLWFSLCFPLSPSLVPNIIRKIHKSKRKELYSTGWERFPTNFVKSVRETLGPENFDSLTSLAQKYHLFNQNLFAHPESFRDFGNEMTRLEITCLLTSLGNELVNLKIVEDAEAVFRIALVMRPENFAARTMLAEICYESERISEAREHARRAITDMDSITQLYKKYVTVPQQIGDENPMDSYRSILNKLIAEGNASD